MTCHWFGNFDEADAIYAQIVAADPTNAAAIHLRGVVSYQKGDYASAVHTIQRALSMLPGNPVYLNDLGLAYQALGRLPPAAVRFAAAMNTVPNSAPPAGTPSMDGWKCIAKQPRQPMDTLSIAWWKQIEPLRQPVDATSIGPREHVDPLLGSLAPEAGVESPGSPYAAR
jgi:tetratricopeptide (TPR) repeat protein